MTVFTRRSNATLTPVAMSAAGALGGYLLRPWVLNRGSDWERPSPPGSYLAIGPLSLTGYASGRPEYVPVVFPANMPVEGGGALAIAISDFVGAAIMFCFGISPRFRSLLSKCGA
jgi:hypothetical protein